MILQSLKKQYKYVSSANYDTKNVLLATTISLISSLFVSDISRISARLRKIYGERISACLQPRSTPKLLETQPFAIRARAYIFIKHVFPYNPKKIQVLSG